MTSTDDDAHSLTRFVRAQDDAPSGTTTYDQALAEVRAGEKVSHWMWFIYPQLRTLGRSPTALFYGIADLDEARAYWAHPILGPRMREAVRATLASGNRDAVAIFGDIDATKLRSCLTLFLAVAPDDPDLRRALDHFYDGVADPITVAAVAP